MGRHRTDMHRLQELVRLVRLKRSARDVSRLLSMGRDTIRAYVEAFTKAGLLEGEAAELPAEELLAAAVREHVGTPPPPPQQRSKVEPWREEIERQRKKGAKPTAIHDWLRLNLSGYSGSLSGVKRLCRRLDRAEGPVADDVAIRVETAPGEVAQVDFAYAGLRYDPARGVVRRSWLFVMTLAFSRHQFADLVFDQRSETWIRLHIAAFEHFGGVPKVIVPDNLKAAVVRAAFGVSADPVLHRTYRELARHYGFQIDPAPPRSPQKKGKVERNVGYVRRNFLATNDSVDIETDRRALSRWLLEVAATRRHGTTGRVVIELFTERERQALLALPAARFETVVWKEAKVHRDTHVQVDGAFYSVPWPHVTKSVWVRIAATQLLIYVGDDLVAAHPRLTRGERRTVEAHLPEHRGPWRHRAKEHWTGKAAQIGEEVRALADDIFAQDDVLHQLRKVQAVVTLLEGYPKERARKAAVRARRFGCLDYRGIKNILIQGLDLLPSPDDQQEFEWIRGARFARRTLDVPVPTMEDTSHVTEG